MVERNVPIYPSTSAVLELSTLTGGFSKVELQKQVQYPWIDTDSSPQSLIVATTSSTLVLNCLPPLLLLLLGNLHVLVHRGTAGA
jgi:hypothetical protein